VGSVAKGRPPTPPGRILGIKVEVNWFVLVVFGPVTQALTHHAAGSVAVVPLG
jgi:hypothetical protein